MQAQVWRMHIRSAEVWQEDWKQQADGENEVARMLKVDLVRSVVSPVWGDCSTSAPSNKLAKQPQRGNRAQCDDGQPQQEAFMQIMRDAEGSNVSEKCAALHRD